MSNVYSLAIYGQLSRLEKIAEHLKARASRSRDGLLLLHADNLRDACKGMRDALAQAAAGADGGTDALESRVDRKESRLKSGGAVL